MPLYRRLRFGDLVDVNMLDTRQHRDDQPCHAGDGGGGGVVSCPERVDPRRTILGAQQRRWLLRGLDRSAARRNVLAQQVVMAELDLHPGPGRSLRSDAWDGYAADRQRILDALWERQPPTRSCSPATSTRSSSTSWALQPRPGQPGGRHRVRRHLDQLRRRQVRVVREASTG
jgi:alkaline phosphatase D